MFFFVVTDKSMYCQNRTNDLLNKRLIDVDTIEIYIKQNYCLP